MVTFEPISVGELATRTGRVGVYYGDATTGKTYIWNGTQFTEPLAGPRFRPSSATITGAATATAAQVATGRIVYIGGAATVTLPTATLLAAELRAVAGTAFEFIVDTVGASGTCTVAVGSGIVAGAAVITGGATLTVANSATQGVGIFRLEFISATAAVLFRVG